MALLIRWPCETPVNNIGQGWQAVTTTWPMAENIYSKGTRVWFTDKEQGWISAEVTNVVKGSGDKIKLTFVDDRGKVTNCFFATYASSDLISGNRNRYNGKGYQGWPT